MKASSGWGRPAGEMLAPPQTRPISSPQPALLDNIPGGGTHTLRAPRKGSAAQSREQGGLNRQLAVGLPHEAASPGPRCWPLGAVFCKLLKALVPYCITDLSAPGWTAQGHLLLGLPPNCPEGCAGYKLPTQGMAEPHPLCKTLLPSRPLTAPSPHAPLHPQGAGNPTHKV